MVAIESRPTITERLHPTPKRNPLADCPPHMTVTVLTEWHDPRRDKTELLIGRTRGPDAWRAIKANARQRTTIRTHYVGYWVADGVLILGPYGTLDGPLADGEYVAPDMSPANLAGWMAG